MEQPLGTEYSPPDEEKQKDSSSAGTAILFGVGLVVAFAVGLVAGFVVRPMAIKDVPVQVVVTVVPPVQEVAQAPTPTDPSAEVAPPLADEPTDETPPTSEPTKDPNATPTPTIMEYVLSDARHIQGREDAPVTVVEFSDFK